MAKKEITFRSRYKKHRLKLEDAPKIRFDGFLFRTSDPSTIAALRKEAKKNSSPIREIDPNAEIEVVKVVPKDRGPEGVPPEELDVQLPDPDKPGDKSKKSGK